jgi:phospholipase C
VAAISDIETIVVLMLENRSFDNVLGHLSHPKFGARTDVDGLQDEQQTAQYDNFFDHQAYKPFPTNDKPARHDLPHGRGTIASQIEVIGGQATMAGFVASYVKKTQSVVKKSPPMGFLRPKGVPVSGFFAEEYLICDRWFSPLPTGTQANRAVAFTGSTLIENNVRRIIPHGQLIFDWLEARGVPWRVYHSGISFFVLFGAFAETFGPNFRSIRRLPSDYQNDPDPNPPKVIFIEPEYEDSPIHFGFAPNDNHLPLPIGPGERLLLEVYQALTANPARWARTLFVVTYDEHGGFYDHVPPVPIRMDPPAGAEFSEPFTSTGVRVPTFVVSPLVERRAVCSATLDHTSILQLFGEMFGSGPNDYSPEVTARRQQGITSLSQVLSPGPIRDDTPTPPPAPIVTASSVTRDPNQPATELQDAFLEAARACRNANPAAAIDRFPELAMLKDPS